MKNLFAICTLTTVTVLTLLQPIKASDAHYPSGIKIDQPWSRATPGTASVGAAYLVIHNTDKTADRLIGISTPIAETAEIHTHVMDNGMMLMQQLPAVDLTPDEPAVFKPGGHHIMLIGLKQPLREGERFQLTLTFAQAHAITFDVAIKGIGAMSPLADEMSKPMGMEHTGHKME